MSRQLAFPMAVIISSGVRPAAKAPETSPPMLVPAMQSICTPVFTEHLEHADVRRAARAAPAEDEADARTFRRRDGAGEQGQCRQAAGHGAPGTGTAKAGRRMGGHRGGRSLHRMWNFHGVLP